MSKSIEGENYTPNNVVSVIRGKKIDQRLVYIPNTVKLVASDGDAGLVDVAEPTAGFLESGGALTEPSSFRFFDLRSSMNRI